MTISIVIVNFNSGLYLEKALLSVISQKKTSHELIVIDGGSVDNSISIIRKYSSYIDYWSSKRDDGQSDALNIGFKIARGEYLMWLNSDDVLVEGSLEKIDNYLSKNVECNWLTFNTVIIDEKDSVTRYIRGPKWNEYLINNYGPQVDSATSVFRKSLFEMTSGFDLRLNYAMDIDLWLQFIRLGVRYERLNEYVYAFRVHSGSKTAGGGYGEKPNKERVLQSKIIKQKNNFNPNRIGGVLAMLNKAIFCKPMCIIDKIVSKTKIVT